MNDGKGLKNEWVTMSRSRCIRMGWRLQWKQLKTKRYETKTDSEDILNDIEILFRYYWRYKCVDLLNGLHEDKRLKIDLVTYVTFTVEVRLMIWIIVFQGFFRVYFFLTSRPPWRTLAPPRGGAPHSLKTTGLYNIININILYFLRYSKT